MTKFIQIAIEEAKKAAERSEVPVGAVLVCDGKVIAQSGNKCEELKDPKAHAEMLVLTEAGKILGDKFLEKADLYVTLEPCPMCASAISFSRIRRVYYGASDPKSGGAFLWEHANLHHKPEVYSGIAENECGNLMTSFFAGKRG